MMVARRKKRVLFLCSHNSARSQMAEGLLRSLHGDRYESYSAGITPTKVHPMAVQVMAELGIDISRQWAKSIKDFHGPEFDIVVTVCDNAAQACPFFPGKEMRHRSFEDPAAVEGPPEVVLEAFRKVRDEMAKWIMKSF